MQFKVALTTRVSRVHPENDTRYQTHHYVEYLSADTLMKAETLRQVLNPHYDRAEVVVHVFDAKQKSVYLTLDSISEAYSRINDAIEQETGNVKPLRTAAGED